MSHRMFMRLFLVVLVSCIGYVYVGSVIIQHPGSDLGGFLLLIIIRVNKSDFQVCMLVAIPCQSCKNNLKL